MSKKAETTPIRPLRGRSGMWKEIGHVEKPGYPTSHQLIQKTNQIFTETFDFYPTAA